MKICSTCAIEHAEPLPELCAICSDERQYLPRDGQSWTDLADLRADHELTLSELEPGLGAVRVKPRLGIGQTSLLLRTEEAGLLWDPPGYFDDAGLELLTAQGPITAIAASHPHMFGVQVTLARALGGVPVQVNAADREWLQVTDPLIEYWEDTYAVDPDVTLHRIGGHFPGSAVAHWAAGADGRGVLLTGDGVFPNPDRKTVSFMRSFPNYIPLSGPVTLRIANHLAELSFDRIYGNFGNVLPQDAHAAVQFSAARHAAWASGEYDHLT